MTSEELYLIYCKTRRTKGIVLSIEQAEELIKDLEILDLLKNKLFVSVRMFKTNEMNLYILTIGGAQVYIPKEIYYKLKEWLDDKY